jgi:hypothetical protein
MDIPELKQNPFRQQVARVFSHSTGDSITFDDYLDFLSVFSEEVKCGVVTVRRPWHYRVRINE